MDKKEYERRRKEDFDLLVLCQLKRNMAMYDLLRDRSLDDVRIEDEQELRLLDGG